MPSENDSIQAPRYLIIPAAGLGTRMRPVNPLLPKELLPVGNKPAIQYTVEEGLSAGITRFVIIISRQKESIRRYFEDRQFRTGLYPEMDRDVEHMCCGCSMTFLYQKELLGEADAIGCAEPVAGDHAVGVIYPDNLYIPAPGALKILRDAFVTYGKDAVALSAVPPAVAETISNAGRVDLRHMEKNIYSIERFIPKSIGHFVPRFSNELRSCGIYVSGPWIFEYIRRQGHTAGKGEFTDIHFRDPIVKERGMIGCALPGTVFDIGNPAGYALCTREMGQGRTHGAPSGQENSGKGSVQ